jgi:hypothetical protein
VIHFSSLSNHSFNQSVAEKDRYLRHYLITRQPGVAGNILYSGTTVFVEITLYLVAFLPGFSFVCGCLSLPEPGGTFVSQHITSHYTYHQLTMYYSNDDYTPASYFVNSGIRYETYKLILFNNFANFHYTFTNSRFSL